MSSPRVGWELLSSAKREAVEAVFAERDAKATELAQTLLDSSPVGVKETPARLLLLRCVLQFAPRHVWTTVRVGEATLRWATGVQTLPEEEASNAARGASLSVLAMFLKYRLQSSFSLECVADGIAAALQLLAKQLSDGDGSNSTNKTPQTILLHQCVELLEAAGDPSLPWLKRLREDAKAALLPSAAIIASLRPDSSSSGQLVVDSCKVFGMVADIWASTKVHSSPAQEGEGIALRALPSSVLRLAVGANVVHDSMHAAFHAAVSCAAELPPPWEGATGLLQDVLTALGALPLETGLDAQRVELVVGLLGSVLQVGRVFESYAEAEAEAEAAGQCIDAIIALSAKMQTASASTSTITPPQGEEEGEGLRAACRDLRKGCISCSEAVIIAAPRWAPRMQQQFWMLCLEALRSPVLFASAFAKGVTAECATRREALEHPLTAAIVLHLTTAISKSSRYSQAAALDLLTAVEELCAAGCDCLPLASSPLPLLLLQAYNQPPKAPSSRPSKKANKGQGSGRAASKSSRHTAEWKAAVVGALRAVLDMAARCAQPLSDDFKEEFVLAATSEAAALLLALGLVKRYPPPPPSSSSSSKGGGQQNTAPGVSLPLPPSSAEQALAREERRQAAAEAEERFGTRQGEALQRLLHAWILSLAAFMSVPEGLVSSSSPRHSNPTPAQSLEGLLSLLGQAADRPVVLEDDVPLMCSEAELLSAAAVALWDAPTMCGRRRTGHVLPAVRALCCIAKGGGATGSEAAVLFEAAREALLSLAEGVDGEGKGGVLQRLLTALPEEGGQGAEEDVEKCFASLQL